MLNRVILIGRLTQDPDLRFTPNTGSALSKFTIAVDRPYQAGKKEKETDFIRIVCWGKLAELCKEHLGKGRLVAVDGMLQIRNWETPQGERRSMVEVRADVVRFLDRAPAATRGGGDFDGPGPEAYEDAAPAPPRDYGKISDKEIDEEIDLNEDPF